MPTFDQAKKRSLLLVLLTLLSLCGCGSHKADLSLIPAPTPRQPNGEELRKAQLQLIQYFSYDTGQYVTADDSTISGLLLDECTYEFGPTVENDECHFASTSPPFSPCENHVCAGAARLCQARMIKKLVTEPGTVLTLFFGDTVPHIRIEPQSTAANAAMMVRATQVAMIAQRHAATVLDSMIFHSSTNVDCVNSEAVMATPKNGTASSFAAIATNTLVEASQFEEQVASDAVDTILAVSDQELSSSLSATLVADRAISASSLSRGQAVRVMVSDTAAIGLGADSGIQGLSASSLCQVDELTPQATRALQLLRAAAPAPADVLSTSTTADFVDSDRDVGSIKQRLAELWGRSLDGSLMDLMKLTAQDFSDAREYLKQELSVFARSKTKTYPNFNGGYLRYPSTATEPQDRDPAYWGAIARYRERFAADPGALRVGDGLFSFPDDRYMAVREANLFAANTSNLTTSQQSIGDQLALLGSTMQARAPGFVRFDVSQTETEVTTFIDQQAATTKYLVVIGEDGLQCATQGTVEGVPCTSAELATWRACQYATSSGTGVTCGAVAGPPDPTTRIYVLRSKTGAETPGDYEALLGASPNVFAPYDSPAPAAYAKTFSIAQDVDRRIAEIIKPNKHSCSRPRLSCAGANFDERMPLENELANDNDPVESSWQHYLQLAKDAATTADQLGTDLIVSQLNVDVRNETVEMRDEQRQQDAEAAINDLQSACGTNVDPMQLLLALSGASDPKDLTNIRQRGPDGQTVSCSSNGECQGSSGYACLNGVCMKAALDPASVLAATTDPSLKDALSRISECIGENTTAPFVSLGTDPVCVWYPNDEPSQVCKSSTPDLPCPDFAVNGSCDSMLLPAGFTRNVNTQVVLVQRQLGYFTSGSDPTPKPQLCADLHRIRASQSETPELDRAIATEIFHPFNLADLAPRIGWSAALGGGGTVTLDGHSLYGPRDAVYQSGGMLDWCDGCTSNDDWAKLDDRTLRAVVALRGTVTASPTDTQTKHIASLRGISMPFYLETKTVPSLKDGTPTLATYPGSSIPVQVIPRQFTGAFPDGFNDPQDPDVGPQISQFHLDETSATIATLPAAWRAPDASGALQNFSPIHTEGGRTYEFAIGDVGLFNDIFQFNKFTRLSWWGRMSSSAIPALIGGIWDKYTEPGGGGINLFSPVPSYLPGAPWRGVIALGADPITIPGVAVGIPFADFSVGSTQTVTVFFGPGECRDPNNPNTLFDPISDPPSIGGQTGCYYNVAPILQPFDYTRATLQDAAELTCAARRSVEEFGCDFKNPPKIEHPQDYKKAEAFIQCASQEIERHAGQTVLSGFPERAIDALRKVSRTGAYPAIGGTVGEDISHLRAALIEVAGTQNKLSYQMDSLANDFDTLSTALEKSTIRDEVADTQFQSATSSQLAACGEAVAGSATVDFVAAGGHLLGAAFTCANSLAQIQFAGTLDDLAKDDTQLDRRQSITEFRQRFSDRALAFQGIAENLSTQLEEIDARLADIEKTQQEARRALGQALYKASAAASDESMITTVQGNIAAVAQERYQRANKNAIHLAFLAKRAIENRLGVKLSNMRSDLPLVEAPATWESSVCASTGVDYTALKKDVADFKANTFADQFVGDYVTKLENVVESYRLANDFHEGDDTSIVSLRDDIFNVRATCEVPSRNLLALSGQQDLTASGSDPGWTTNGCPDGDTCVGVRRATELKGPGTDGEVSAAGLFGLTFVPGSSRRKTVSLAPGQYVLSWYVKNNTPNVALLNADGTVIPTAIDGTSAVAAENGFSRLYTSYVLTKGVNATLSISADDSNEILLSGVMLELRNDGAPSAYENTSALDTHRVADCPDVSGETFRRTRWKHRCEQLCSNGFADSCDGNAATTQCFWETAFSINQRGIEAGDILNLAGFAKGNFNYRLSDIAVNFVGTGLLSCGDSSSPQACAGSGNIQYSLVHGGPYYVRNHDGADAPIQLFEGHIEHARGLATERYLTNPLSSSDSDLISQYLRTELRGRPLDGNFTIQVWDKQGVDFDAVQDIQLLLKYRYWTRFD